jgi:hypothetical protein
MQNKNKNNTTAATTAATTTTTATTTINNNIFALVLSEYREHLNQIEKELLEQEKFSKEKLFENKFITMGYLTGGMKKAEKEISKQSNIILATYAKAGKGLNIPQLNVLYYTTPRSDIRQSSGRVLRKLRRSYTATCHL